LTWLLRMLKSYLNKQEVLWMNNETVNHTENIGDVMEL
jgi:hypothetical protein